MSGSATAPNDPYAGGHGSTVLHVEHYDLDLDYRVRTNRLTGTARLRVRTLAPVTELELDLARLAVHGVTVTGATLARYRHRGGRLVVRLGEPVAADAVLHVTVDYGGAPRPVDSRWGPVGWEELEDGVVVASQPTGAPSWFPCNDRPDDKATYRTSVTVENPYRVVAHGVPSGRVVRAGTTTWLFEETHPTPAYLATVQIGRYDDVALASGPVPQRVLAPPALAARARARLAHHPAIMELFTGLFGPYPFAGYALVVTADPLEIPVEAQGMAIFGSNHLDEGSDGDRLVPHELAHQWFGNSVSVASWRDLWLNEGFACYAEWLWSEASGGPDADALATRHHAALAALPQDLVLADPGPDDMFDDRVYKRGALTVHALRRTLGDEAFWPLVRDWTTRHRGGAVSTADLRLLALEHAGAAGDASGDPALRGRVDVLLSAWLDRAPLPDLPLAPAAAAAGTTTARAGQPRSAASSGAPS